jgi:hypothetical protein
MRRRPHGLRRSIDRGTRRSAIELRNQALRGANAVKRGRVVPDKLPNKGGTLPPAEGVEERRPIEGNTPKAAASRTQSRTSASMALQRVQEVARRDRRARFTALLHHISPELLRESFYALKRTAAPGINGVRWNQHEVDLSTSLPNTRSESQMQQLCTSGSLRKGGPYRDLLTVLLVQYPSMPVPAPTFTSQPLSALIRLPCWCVSSH